MRSILVRQEEDKDCGAACILSILKYYNGYVPLEKIRNDTLTDKNGTNFYNMKYALNKYGFEVYGYYNYNIQLDIPIICQVKNNNNYHFVVVYKINKKIYVMDPAKGYLKYEIDEFNNYFTGYYLVPISKGTVVKLKNKKAFFKYIKQIFYNNKFLVFKNIILNIMLILISFIILFIINNITNGNNLMSLFVFISFFKVILIIYQEKCVASFDYLFSKDLLINYCKRILYLPFKYIRLKSKGDLLSRVNDLISIKDFFSKSIFEIIGNIFLFILSSLILFHYYRYYSLIIFLFSLFYFMLLYYFNKKSFSLIEEYLNSYTDFHDYLSECIDGLFTINLRNKNNYYYKKLEDKINNTCDINYLLQKKISKIKTLNQIYSDILIIIFIVISLLNDNISNVFIGYLFFEYFKNSVVFFSSLLPSYFYFKSVFNRVSSLYDIDYVMKSETNITGDIIIKDLCINYGNKIILNNFNEKIIYGSKVLLKGNNGTGKSTFIHSITGLIDNYSGIVLYGNSDLKFLSNYSISGSVRIVSCNEKLFKDSIINNIIEGSPYDKRRFDILCDLLELNIVIRNKNLSYDSLIDNNLSNGEIQLIILARALYQDFDYLFIDEGLSNISLNLRDRIIDRIFTLYKNKTIVIVSHNNINSRYFDKVIDFNLRKENNDR